MKNLLVPPKTFKCENDFGGFVVDFNYLSGCSVTKFSAQQTATKYGFMAVNVPAAADNALCCSTTRKKRSIRIHKHAQVTYNLKAKSKPIQINHVTRCSFWASVKGNTPLQKSYIPSPKKGKSRLLVQRKAKFHFWRVSLPKPSKQGLCPWTPLREQPPYPQQWRQSIGVHGVRTPPVFGRVVSKYCVQMCISFSFWGLLPRINSGTQQPAPCDQFVCCVRRGTTQHPLSNR